jgi:hypothetical protein
MDLQGHKTFFVFVTDAAVKQQVGHAKITLKYWTERDKHGSLFCCGNNAERMTAYKEPCHSA